MSKKCQGSLGLEELYKRWFDNVKEYMDRKEERLSKKDTQQQKKDSTKNGSNGKVKEDGRIPDNAGENGNEGDDSKRVKLSSE